MLRRRKLKSRVRRHNGNKARRLMRIYRLKRSIAQRRRIGFVVLNSGI